MKRLVAVLLALMVVSSFAFAGGGSQSSGGAAASGEKTIIGLAMPETHVLRWYKDGNSLKAEAEKRGYTALVQWADANQAIQNGQIQSFILQGAKALLIGPINDGVTAAVAEAAREGVLVVAYDRLIQNSSDYDYFITFNSFKVGQLQGQSIVKALDLDRATTSAPKNITLFAGSITDDNAFFFYNGAMSVLNPYIDKGVLKVVGPYPRTTDDRANFQRITTENWVAQVAKTRMENLLTGDARDVTLDAVLAPNDPIARAIIEACKADAKYRTKLPVVCGQDAEFDSVLSIKNGEQNSTIFKDTSKLAAAAITLTDQLLKKQPINVPGVELATGDLAKIGDTGKKTVKVYLMDIELITKDNILVPVNAGFYSDLPASDVNKLR